MATVSTLIYANKFSYIHDLSYFRQPKAYNINNNVYTIILILRYPILNMMLNKYVIYSRILFAGSIFVNEHVYFKKIKYY